LKTFRNYDIKYSEVISNCSTPITPINYATYLEEKTLKKLSVALCALALSFGIIRMGYAAGISIPIPIDIIDVQLHIGTFVLFDNSSIIIDPDSSYFLYNINSTYEEPIISFNVYLDDPYGVFDDYHFSGGQYPPTSPSGWSFESGDEQTNYQGNFDMYFQSPDGPIFLYLYNWDSGPDFAISIISTEFIGYQLTNPLLAGYRVTEGYLNRVPVPPGLWLLGSGLIGLFAFKKIPRNFEGDSLLS